MISSKRVLVENIIPFSHVQVDYEGCTYAGPGLGRWQIDTGLSVDGVLKNVRGECPKRVEFGVPRFGDRSAMSTIRFRAGSNRGVIFTRGQRLEQAGLVANGHFEMQSTEFVSWDRESHPPMQPCGVLVLEGKHGLPLPDVVKTEVCIAKRKLGESLERGLDYHANGYDILVRPNGDETYTISWGLPNVTSLSVHIGNWPRALALAWQFVQGKSVRPVASDVRDTRRRIVVVAKREEPVALRPFSLVDSNTCRDGATLLALARLFASNDTKGLVAQHLLAQCFDAARNRTWQGIMFLLGTALEAVLRTLYGHPFAPHKKHDTFKIKACLDELWNDYFGDDWSSAKIRTKDTFDRVRHRASHPDWLRSFGGALSSNQEEEAFDDLVYLSRFYGYLILAMAGAPNLTPRFPVPVSQWKPAMTFERGCNSDDDQLDQH